MFYLGIDIGKNTHVASLIDKLSQFKESLEVGMEATGHYWLSLYSFLLEQKLLIHVVNPIQTDGYLNL